MVSVLSGLLPSFVSFVRLAFAFDYLKNSCDGLWAVWELLVYQAARGDESRRQPGEFVIQIKNSLFQALSFQKHLEVVIED
jgi:hypothetical protein